MLNVLRLLTLLISISIFTTAANADWKGVSTVTSGIPSGNGSNLRLGALPDGSAIAVWSQTVPASTGKIGFTQIYASVRTNGVWATPEIIGAGHDKPLAVRASMADLVVAPDGTATVAWFREICVSDTAGGCNITSAIEATTRSTSGVWSLPVTLTDTDSSKPDFVGQGPSVDTSSDGTITAVWVGQAGMLYTSVRNPASGTWSTSEEITVCNPGAPGFRFDLDVAPDGTAAVIFLKAIGGLYGVYVDRRFNGSWVGASLISTFENSFGNNSYPDIAVGNGGRAAAVWQQYNGSTANLRTASALPATFVWIWLSPTVLSTTLDVSQTVPLVAMNSAGRAVAAWTQLPNRAIQAAIEEPTESAFGAPTALLGTPNGLNWGSDYTVYPGADDSFGLGFSHLTNGLSSTASSIVKAAILKSNTTTWDIQQVSGTSRGGGIVQVDATGGATAAWPIPGASGNFSGVESSSTVFEGSAIPTPTSTIVPTLAPTPTPRAFSTKLTPKIISLVKNVSKLTITAIVETIKGTAIAYELKVSGPNRYAKTLTSKKTKFTLSKLKKGKYSFKYTATSKVKNKTSRSKSSKESKVTL